MDTKTTNLGNNSLKELQDAAKESLGYGPAVTNALNREYAKEEGNLRETDTIVRFLSVEHFLYMVKTGCNVLTRVTTWKDVYEGWILRLQYTDCNNVSDLLKNYYGQCWSLREADSELQWNARSSNETGVCLKSTVGKLAKSIMDQYSLKEKIIGIGRLDKITYDDQPKDYSTMKFDGKSISEFFSDTFSILNSFFSKRYEFNDEHEVRMVLDLPENTHNDVMKRFYQENGDLLLYKFGHPEEFIDEVIFNPKMCETQCNYLKCFLERSGWDKVKIGRSRLYELPKQTVTLFHD